MKYRDNFRRAVDWKSESLPLSTTSDEACQLYDAALTQVCGFYDDPNFGGLAESFTKLTNADPNFVLGQALALYGQLLGTRQETRTPKLNIQLRDLIKITEKQSQSSGLITEREVAHVNAIELIANGDLFGATRVWEEILINHPLDIHALVMANHCYFNLGLQKECRDSVARVVPVWKAKNSIPLRSTVYGWQAFGLHETGNYTKSMQCAKLALSEDIYNGWATHALAHVFEMQGDVEEGIQFMSTTEKNWEHCNYLASHNYWHWSLYHIEKGEHELAGQLFEQEILKRALQLKSMLNIHDVTSFLFRLQLDGASDQIKPNYWSEAYQLCEPHLRQHFIGHNDIHFGIACVGLGNQSAIEEFVESIPANNEIMTTIVKPLIESLIEFNAENYRGVVELINPIRYQIQRIGGSDAQRDIWNQLLILSALKSPLTCHHNLAERLIREREAQKSTPMVEKFKNAIRSKELEK